MADILGAMHAARSTWSMSYANPATGVSGNGSLVLPQPY